MADFNINDPIFTLKGPVKVNAGNKKCLYCNKDAKKEKSNWYIQISSYDNYIVLFAGTIFVEIVCIKREFFQSLRSTRT
jgi:hypothetical protein